ncbi:hypothetical protein AcV7_006869 [Taiwanofungus camphoratus]|nr:hypothetical protein AcV7_006869 [Antrodia cinnamomea]
MPRRTLTPATPTPTTVSTVLPRDPSQLAQSDPSWSANLQLLRRQWKWAVFSQFFYTFAPLLAMGDVTLADVEDDFARSTTLYLPRIMQRLLYTLTQDRKITIDTWQTALRKQYMKRDPEANPIGPEPKAPSRESSREASVLEQNSVAEGSHSRPSKEPVAVDSNADIYQQAEGQPERSEKIADNTPEPETAKSEPPEEVLVKKEDTVESVQENEEQEESKDWCDLPMLVKLDSLHFLIEWQCQNPHRLRSIMKDDDEGAQWRIEPIGYDAKTNAYWLIGPDRLWIQRVLPKLPKGVKRKRPTAKASAQPSTSKVEQEDYDYDSQKSPKRKRVQTQPISGRVSRSRTQQSSLPAVDQTPSSKGTRAAKLQANQKLDAQAKELAEFQRQAASLARSNSRTSRQAKSQTETQTSPSRSPRKAAVGTRTSARLRGATSKDEDEWQQIPEEWLQETVTPQAESAAGGKSRDKEKAREEEAVEAPAEASGPVTEELKTGLESDENASELTELSEEVDGGVAEKERQDQPHIQPNGENSGGRKTRSKKRADPPIPANNCKKENAIEEVFIDDASRMPTDFVEWETLCVTLYEWEHIAERFEQATHYLEKALYKVLSQHIVPAVTAELREVERKRKIEEAIVHRKRSSRIAIKESEKEEARLVAKKKAEEAEKMARAKRLEARVKKEEAEREKREHAREQRRIEREEREQRARAKQERAEARAKDTASDRQSTTTPAINGTHSTDSVQLSTVTTPSGVQTPNWVLDCEICHKHGINVDDGLPMVSCGACAKWQHITCHDRADQQAGRPRRNWDVGQFYCQRCRARALSGLGYNPPPSTSMAQPEWSQRSSNPAILPQKTASTPFNRDLYAQSTSDVRFLTRQPNQNGVSYGHEQYAQNNVPPQPVHTRPQQSRSGLTFAHYQPDQRAFSTVRASQQSPVQSTSWANGYPPMDSMNARAPQSVQFISQYSHNGGSYANNRIPPAYQGSPITQTQPYGTAQGPVQPIANSQWGTGANGYSTSDSAARAAAESLTFMQGISNGQHNGWHHNVHLHPQNSSETYVNRDYPTMHTEHHPMGGAPSYHYSSAS